MAFLLLHGLDGSGPAHWQTWLAAQLRERGHHVAYPALPQADAPRLDRWLAALQGELEALPAAQTTVLCHSLGCLLWLHYAARRPAVAVARALLVAPPQPDVEDPPSVGFRPTPADAAGVSAASNETLLVCSTDDPNCPPETSRRLAREARIPLLWVEAGGHINADAGFGAWPTLEAWCLDRRDAPV